MLRIGLISFLVGSGLCVVFSQAKLPDPRLHASVMSGIDLTWQEQYRKADSVFQVIIQEFPNHPAGYVYKAALMQSKAMDNEMEIDVAVFDSLIELGKSKGRQLVDSGMDKQWGYFFLGTADGSDSYARVYRGDWFGGTRKGFTSVSSFKDALKLDSTLHDAEVGIGAFNYWRSRKTEYFNWIPFVGDDRPEAFDLIQRSIEKGVYNRYTALSVLSAICMDAGKYERAIACCEEGLKRYPANRTFLWVMATAWGKLEVPQKAVAAYQRLLQAILHASEDNHYNELVCRLNLATLQRQLRDFDSATEELKAINNYHVSDFPKHLQSRAEDKLTKAKELLQANPGNGNPAGNH